MNKTCTVRNVVIGEGMPKICVPIVGKNEREILNALWSFRGRPHDMVEWRADWFEGIRDEKRMLWFLEGLRREIGEAPLLFTIRTMKEGGALDIEPEEYLAVNKFVVKSGFVDLVDFELFTGDDYVKELIETAHESGVKVILSSHDFAKTPEYDDMKGRLLKMQDLGADLLKLAVMPVKRRDVLTLLEVTEEVSRIAEKPIVTMSMSMKGMISRLSGEFFGSVMTFGSVGEGSAPGQMNLNDLHEVLNAIHNAIGQESE